MSNNLRTYPSIPKDDKSCTDLHITSTFQGRFGPSVQFTIYRQYCILSENQIVDLIDILSKFINHESGYGSSDNDLDITVKPEKSKT